VIAYALIVAMIGLTAAGVSRLLRGNADARVSEAGDDFSTWRSTLGFFIIDAILVLGACVALRFIDRRPIALLGLSVTRRCARELALGACLGAGAIVVSCVSMWAAGALVVTPGTAHETWSVGLMWYTAAFLVAAACEELIMRGYPFQAVVEGLGTPLAVLVFGLVFGLGHMTNSGFSAVGLATTSISGVMMSVAYLRTRSLWLPIALHFSWNWTQGCLWGMNVSGLVVTSSFLKTTPAGTALLNGGDFGAEGSVITLVVGIALTLSIWKAPWLTPSEKNARLWLPYLPRSTESTLDRSDPGGVLAAGGGTGGVESHPEGAAQPG
jgi:hypothetical protein